MLIFGITGSINHGKSTFSDALTSLMPNNSVHFSSSGLIGSVAESIHESTTKIPDSSDIEAINTWLKPLPGILNELMHTECSFEQIRLTKTDVEVHPEEFVKLFIYLDKLKGDPSLLKQKIDAANRETYRPFLQWLGGYLKRVNPGIWYEEIVRRGEIAKSKGAKLCLMDGIRFNNDAEIVKNAGGVVVEVIRPSMEVRDINDPTERERKLVKADIKIINNGTIAELKEVAKQLLKDGESNKYKKIYKAVT